jgi:Rrf2 family transcriptional regulator, nitric oxide-sensitive transcriptional repressor
LDWEAKIMLPKTAEYALRAVVWLASEEERAHPADQIAAATRIPRRYLHKVLQALVRVELVRSQPGPRGGYALGRPPDAITLLEVVRAVGGIERILACPLDLKTHTSLCPLHRELDSVYAGVEEAFGRVTVAQILQQQGAVRPLCEAKP